jgi:uncharacterized membrane protein
MNSVLRHMKHRPALIFAATTGAGTGFIASLFMPCLRAALIGWCLAVMVYLVGAVRYMARATLQSVKARALLLDEGKWPVLIVTLTAALMSIAAIVAEVALAQQSHFSMFNLLFGLLTVLLSWLFIHVLFAQLYAHQYWIAQTGIQLPGQDGAPSFVDFVYFSFVIGMTCQVSDVVVTTKEMRRLVLVHGLTAFLFNTVILALTVNLAATASGNFNV